MSKEIEIVADKERGNWIQTYTGIKMFVMDPRPEEISIHDIAHSLSNQCRFTGHSREFYSIAQHSVLVSELLPAELKLVGLLHDASEAYLTDVARPVKEFLSNYKDIEDKLMQAIAQKFSFDWPSSQELKDADNAALIAEQLYLFPYAIDNWTIHFINKYYTKALGKYRVPMYPWEAKKKFLEVFKEVGIGEWEYECS